MDRAVFDAYGWRDAQPVCGFALDWLGLDDDELVDTLASAPDDIRDRIESADYFFAADACRCQADIKQSGKAKLPWRYRWPDDTRDDILARLLALNAAQAEVERLTGRPGAGTRTEEASAGESESDSDFPTRSKTERAKKATTLPFKSSALRRIIDDPDHNNAGG